MITIIQLEVHHKKPLPDLSDMAADRVYKMQGVNDVTIKLVVKPEDMAKCAQCLGNEHF